MALQEVNKYHQPWGKLERDESNNLTGWLPLSDHCLDVAAVFRRLLDITAIRRSIESTLGRNISPAQIERLSVFAYLHDIGKCNSGFQSRRENPNLRVSHVREAAPLFFDQRCSTALMATSEVKCFSSWCSKEAWPGLLLASISHHGRPAFSWLIADTNEPASFAYQYWRVVEGYDPLSAATQLLESARTAFPIAFDSEDLPIDVPVAFEHLFAGLVMLADWIGSHKRFFPFVHEGNRSLWSPQRAAMALSAIGLDVDLARKHVKEPPDFLALFDNQPRPLQERLASSELPPLLIAESDTGSGKTEAALMHYFSLFVEGKVDSLYFALPTRVAAKELYERVRQAAEKFFGTACPPVLLAVPGYAKVDGIDARQLLPDSDVLWHEASQRISDRLWSAERPKRFLGAPIAVGTIDQILMSTIQLPHAHLRASCLSRSLIVIDEVHSSDVYMRYLTRRLLVRHLDTGGHALLLSATLGAAARAEYLYPKDSIPAPLPIEEAINLPYPSLTSATGVVPFVDHSGRSKSVRLEPVCGGLETFLPSLRGAVAAGQRVLVVLNTVARAIHLGRLADKDPILGPALFSCNGIRCVHHGRYARADREVLDQGVTKCFGKTSRTGAMLLIGTQTLEQSLDIDADWLLTDLCPIDVLLQRIGREHRHQRGLRPAPVCTVILPEEVDFASFIGRNGEVRQRGLAGLGSVYEDLRILQLTRDIVASGRNITIPRDNRRLVEDATHPERLKALASEAWLRHAHYLSGVMLAQKGAGNIACIPFLPFGEFEFQRDLNGHLATRLGLDARVVNLCGFYDSPFGLKINELNIPGYMANGIDPEGLCKVKRMGLDLMIESGSTSFQYSRFGLEKLAT